MLKDVRIKKGLTQGQLAELSGVKFRMVQHYEQGSKNIDRAKIETLCDFAEALDCSICDILNDEKLIERVKKSVW